jgi:hypothetical protein
VFLLSLLLVVVSVDARLQLVLVGSPRADVDVVISTGQAGTSLPYLLSLLIFLQAQSAPPPLSHPTFLPALEILTPAHTRTKTVTGIVNSRVWTMVVTVSVLSPRTGGATVTGSETATETGTAIATEIEIVNGTATIETGIVTETETVIGTEREIRGTEIVTATEGRVRRGTRLGLEGRDCFSISKLRNARVSRCNFVQTGNGLTHVRVTKGVGARNGASTHLNSWFNFDARGMVLCRLLCRALFYSYAMFGSVGMSVEVYGVDC